MLDLRTSPYCLPFKLEPDLALSVLRLIDHRFSGVAQGVGTAKILGRVHLAPIQIGKSYFPCSFTILEDQGIDFLLGLDFLRRFQVRLD